MEEEEEKAPEAKKPKGKLLFIVLGVVVVAAVGAGGVFLGPKLMPKAEGDVQAEPAASAQDSTIALTASMHAIVVDLRDQEGSIHHMKVVLSFELADGVTEEDFKKFSPRGREAAISYLREQSFESVTDPKNFKKVSEELAKRATDGIGAKRVQRVLITDFVSQ
ncbi:MAG TPA: flagellar basal body-associated FliL family protein [Polyangiaceae bacterium]|nr:flagellar basal body-associated FliL family protein [Polyangiaceae bacterium]HMR79124.1 flagellar basal body-associated FliL family protein [Polyangiaceae bacterium]